MQNDIAIDLPSKQTAHAPYTEAFNSFCADLDWRAIHALFDHQDFNPSYKWISQQVGCSVEKVASCIEGLITLGIVCRTSEGFEVMKKDLDWNELGEVSAELRIDRNTLLTQQIAQKREIGIFGMDRIALTASNQELLRELYGKISDAILDFRKKSLDCKKDGVYGVAIVGTDLLQGGRK